MFLLFVCFYLHVWRATKIELLLRQSVGDGSHYFRSISRLFTRENLHEGPLSNSPTSGNVTLAVDKVWEEATIAWNILFPDSLSSQSQPFWIVWISDKGSESEQPFVFSIKYRIFDNLRRKQSPLTTVCATNLSFTYLYLLHQLLYSNLIVIFKTK